MPVCRRVGANASKSGALETFICEQTSQHKVMKMYILCKYPLQEIAPCRKELFSQ